MGMGEAEWMHTRMIEIAFVVCVLYIFSCVCVLCVHNM